MAQLEEQTPHPFKWLDKALSAWGYDVPEAIAVTAGDEHLTGAELVATVDHLTKLLGDAGVAPGDAVGTAFGRSVMSVPAALAVWRAGATLVPTDPRHPPTRTGHVLRDAGVRVVLTDRDVADVLPRAAVTVHPTDRTDRVSQDPVRVDPDAVAYIIYTSGTTGLPKGVEVTAAGLSTFVSAIATLRLDAGGSGVSAVSAAFDGWLWCALLHLTSLQTLHLLDPSDAQMTIRDQIEELQPTVVSLTPSLLTACDGLPDSVGVVIVGGEECPPALVQRHGSARMLNVYGPTEVTIAATWADSASGDDVTSIGHPLPGVSAHVVDEAGLPVEDGEEGELWLAGPSVAKGYRGRPDLTADRFAAAPWGPPGQRMYRTGDIVTRQSDGSLRYLGRHDAQVKVNGVRVELSEVERIATSVDGVTSAVAFTGRTGGSLALAVTLTVGVDEDGVMAAVADRCAARLPAPVVPSQVVRMDRLPITPTGKVDRDALSRMVAGGGAGAAPRTPLESAICEVWAELLELPSCGLDLDFFHAGGHSLLAARAVSALRRRTGVAVAMRDALDHPTPRALAVVLSARPDAPGQQAS